MVPLKFGDHVIGTLELEHHKRKVYRGKDVITINTFANQLATAIHITELRRPLVETVETLTQQLATLARAAVSMREAAGAGAQSTGLIRQGGLGGESEVAGGLEAILGVLTAVAAEYEALKPILASSALPPTAPSQSVQTGAPIPDALRPIAREADKRMKESLGIVVGGSIAQEFMNIILRIDLPLS